MRPEPPPRRAEDEAERALLFERELARDHFAPSACQ
jgi:hypothetical protein